MIAKKFDTWEIQLIMAITFRSNGTNEELYDRNHNLS